MKGGAKVVIEKHRHEGVFIAKVRELANPVFSRSTVCPVVLAHLHVLHSFAHFHVIRRSPQGKDDALVTRNMDTGHSVYGEKRIAVEEGEKKVEYRVWNPFRSKLAAAIVGGVENIYIKPCVRLAKFARFSSIENAVLFGFLLCSGAKLLYLGAASGTTVSHCSDVVGPVRNLLVVLLFVPILVFLCKSGSQIVVVVVQTGTVYAVEFSHRSGRDLINVAKRRTNIIPIIEDAR